MISSAFTNNSKPISGKEDKNKAGSMPDIPQKQRKNANPAASPAKLQSPSRQANG